MARSYLAKLLDRSIMLVEGQECVKFLHGICTQDVIGFAKSPRKATGALFLNPKGRVLFDTMLVKPPDFHADDPSFYVDMHRSVKEAFAENFAKYKTKKVAHLVSLDNILEVTTAFTPGLVIQQLPGSEFKWEEDGDWEELERSEGRVIKGYSAFVDPRLSFMGARTYSLEGALEPEGGEVEICTDDEYHCFRIMHGIGEGPLVSGLLPLNLNFDKLNCISFHKGCYIGQELTQRTHTQGEVRTILMPFIQESKSMNTQNFINSALKAIDKQAEAAKVGQQIVDGFGTVVAKVIESRYNVGLAMVRRELLRTDTPFRLEGGPKVAMWFPDWNARDEKLITGK
mmetsp:Transcript_7575/g.14165  ORF Transcript_7575/g.14165 Transcript_7575/m.14165 type:complete len:342 (+) Transcript_7575:5315-6340(+)